MAVTNPDGRTFTTYFPSVTTILEKVLAKPALAGWYYKQAVEGVANLLRKYGDQTPSDLPSLHSLLSSEGLSPYAQRDEATDHGTKVHKALERLAQGRKVAARPEVESLLEWWDIPKDKVVATEKVAVSFRHQYAGTIDLMYCDMDPDHLTLMDCKTGKNIHWENVLQLEAYALAWEEMYGRKVSTLKILHLPRLGGCYEYDFPAGGERDTWLDIVRIFYRFPQKDAWKPALQTNGKEDVEDDNIAVLG